MVSPGSSGGSDLECLELEQALDAAATAASPRAKKRWTEDTRSERMLVPSRRRIAARVSETKGTHSKLRATLSRRTRSAFLCCFSLPVFHQSRARRDAGTVWHKNHGSHFPARRTSTTPGTPRREHARARSAPRRRGPA